MIGTLSETIPDEVLSGTIVQRQSPADGTPGRGERLATVAIGGILVAAGVRRRSFGGATMAFGGGWLVARGMSGNRRPLRALGSVAVRDRDRGAPDTAMTVEQSVTVGEPADELTRYWRDPEQLTRIMGSFAEVTGAGEDRHHWEVRTPRGPNLTWESEIVEDRPGEVLRWESLEGAPVPNEGSVRFRSAPGDRGTEVTLRLRFDPPGGGLGDTVIQRLGIVPETIAERALHRFKSLAETGEIPTLERNPSARGSGDLV